MDQQLSLFGFEETPPQKKEEVKPELSHVDANESEEPIAKDDDLPFSEEEETAIPESIENNTDSIEVELEGNPTFPSEEITENIASEKEDLLDNTLQIDPIEDVNTDAGLQIDPTAPISEETPTEAFSNEISTSSDEIQSEEEIKEESYNVDSENDSYEYEDLYSDDDRDNYDFPEEDFPMEDEEIIDTVDSEEETSPNIDAIDNEFLNEDEIISSQELAVQEITIPETETLFTEENNSSSEDQHIDSEIKDESETEALLPITENANPEENISNAEDQHIDSEIKDESSAEEEIMPSEDVLETETFLPITENVNPEENISNAEDQHINSEIKDESSAEEEIIPSEDVSETETILPTSENESIKDDFFLPEIEEENTIPLCENIDSETVFSQESSEEDSSEPLVEKDLFGEIIAKPTKEKFKAGKRGRKSFKDIDAEVDLIDVPEDEELFSKQYYPISEVAKWFRVNNSLLRFWENEFDILKPRKNRKGDRLFRPEDIKNLQVIYYLLRNKKYTIEGAKKYLKNNKKTADINLQIIHTLNNFKSFLLELKANAS